MCKIISGFISNSSSSSFIIKDADEMEQAEKLNCEVYPVKNIIDYYQSIKESLLKLKSTVETNKTIPDFMQQSRCSLENILEDIEYEINALQSIKDYSITSLVDCDYAYRLDIDLELYEGDL